MNTCPRRYSRFTIHNSRFTILAFLLFILITPAPAHAYSRIISLKPNITEILFAIGAGPQVVGVTTFCDRPEEAKRLPKVADYIRVDPEQALRLRPDLILGSKENSSEKEVNFLMDRGIPVHLLSFATIPETLESIKKIGKLLGREPQANAIIAQMENELKELRSKSQKVKKKRVLFVVGYHPLIVAGGKNFFDEATQYIGAINVVGKSRLKYPAYTTELLIRAAPEVIVEMGMGSEDTAESQKDRRSWWKRYPSIPAVQKDQIFTFDIEKMRAVPDLPQSLRELFQIIHGNVGSG